MTEQTLIETTGPHRTEQTHETTEGTRAVVAEFFRSLGAGEIEGALALLAEPLEWFTPGDVELIPWMGARSTRAEVRDFFAQAGANLTAEEFVLAKVVADGADAVALGRFRYRVDATGLAFSSPFAVELRVADGRIVRYHMHEDSHAIALAFR
ncbi:nuclear transport factor 2 family protein (plasmid) [Streptomyces sp. BI20]|uniref:nuclear transport factor 2 family protein n=1 Tax=Streptomyces sp. BI20 TaxID=3403460 RepID=UPI003C715282